MVRFSKIVNHEKEIKYAKYIEVSGGNCAGFEYECARLGRTNFRDHRNRLSYWSLLSNWWSNLPLGQQETESTRHSMFDGKYRRFCLQHQHNPCW